MTHDKNLPTFEALEPRQLLSADVTAPALPAEPPPAGADLGEMAAPAGDWRPDRMYFDAVADARASTRVTYVDYMLFDEWGGAYADAEKSPTDDDDDLMCWAAAASNVLEWTGWGVVDGMTNADEMFAYFQDHWADEGGIPSFGWDWWFDGTNDGHGPSGYAQVEVEGGGFYPDEDFRDYYHATYVWADMLPGVDEYLHSGYGVTLFVSTGAGDGHVVTCWGVRTGVDDPGDYLGVWLTDSDDDKLTDTPRDRLRYYNVTFRDRAWCLDDFYGFDDYQIRKVSALQPPPPRLPDFDPYGGFRWEGPIGFQSPTGDPFGQYAAKPAATPKDVVKILDVKMETLDGQGALIGTESPSEPYLASASLGDARTFQPGLARRSVPDRASGGEVAGSAGIDEVFDHAGDHEADGLVDLLAMLRR